MPAFTSFVYASAKKDLKGDSSNPNAVDFIADDIRVLLFKDTYDPSASSGQQNNVVLADILPATNEIVATDYVRKVLANKAITINGNDVELKADKSDFGVVGGAVNDTIGGAIVYKHVDGTAANDRLIAAINATNEPTTQGTNVEFRWGNTNGQGVIVRN